MMRSPGRRLLLLLGCCVVLFGCCGSAHRPPGAAASSFYGGGKKHAADGDKRVKPSRWRSPPAPPPPPGTHMFRRIHEGADPLAWDADDLTRTRDLHARDLNDKAAYLAASTLAEHLGLWPTRQLHVPLPLHIVFLGFQGDGNARVRFDEQVLTEWFGHLDHVLPAARIRLADLSCLDDGHCTGHVDGDMAPPPPLRPSAVRLNFSCNVAVVQRAEVLETYERAVAAFSRPVDPEFESGSMQVDALKMEAFIDSMLEGLGLDSGYALVVANPKWSSSLATYGFRAGFSLDELDLLRDQVKDMRGLSLSHWENEPAPPRGHALAAAGGATSGLLSSVWTHRTRKHAVAQLQSESMAWVKSAQAYLAAEEDHRRKLLKAVGPRTKGALAVIRAVSMLRAGAKGGDTARLLAATITNEPEHFHNAKWRASHPLEDCLTAAWVGHGRWALIDLTATKADYGPALGGEGVVVPGTVPDPAAMFADVADARDAARDAASNDGPDGPREQALRDGLAARVTEAIGRASRAPGELERTLRQAHVAAGGAVGSDDAAAAAAAAAAANQSPQDKAAREQEALLQAELDVYEAFALEHCHNRINPPVACAEARDSSTEIRHELQALAAGSPVALRAFREHHWDIFGLDDAADNAPEVADALARVREHFLGQLADVLSLGVRHVIAPPTAAWRRVDSGWAAAGRHSSDPSGGSIIGSIGGGSEEEYEDVESAYAHKVHFEIRILSDGKQQQRRSAGGGSGAPFDAERFKEQVSRLALPHQSFTFSLTETNLLDDAPLAAAFAASLRTSLAEVPDAAVRPGRGAEVVYVDSLELAHRLRRRLAPRRPAPRGAARAGGAHAPLEIPIFVFSLDRDAPVLVDEHYSARALDDMVLVVANAAGQDEHPTGFMCDGALAARPLSPLRHALAAALQHLGGPAPPHIGYHPGRRRVAHSWLWSVGAHPLSWTSTGTRYSQLHIDALHRSYVVDALDHSVARVNAGVALLARERPSPAGWARVTKVQLQLRQVLHAYAQVVALWRQAAARASELDYDGAVERIAPIEEMAEAFYGLAEEVARHLHPQRCAEALPIAPALVRWAVIGSGAAVAATAVATLALPRRIKAKKGD